MEAKSARVTAPVPTPNSTAILGWMAAQGSIMAATNWFELGTIEAVCQKFAAAAAAKVPISVKPMNEWILRALPRSRLLRLVSINLIAAVIQILLQSNLLATKTS
jgi:hypothetical protein